MPSRQRGFQCVAEEYCVHRLEIVTNKNCVVLSQCLNKQESEMKYNDLDESIEQCHNHDQSDIVIESLNVVEEKYNISDSNMISLLEKLSSDTDVTHFVQFIKDEEV